MLEPLISYLLCGWLQFEAGHRVKGVLLFLGFPSSVALAAHYLSVAHSPRELAIGLVALILAVLIWSYHFLEMKEYSARNDSVILKPRVHGKGPGAARIRTTYEKRVSTNSDELYTQGRIAYLRGSMEEAKDCFEKLLLSDRQDSDAAFQLGRVYHRLGDNRQAERFFRQCQQLPGGIKWSEEIKKYLQENKS